MVDEQNQLVERPGRALKDYVVAIFDGNMSNILKPMVTMNNFKIKPILITMI